MNPLRLTLQGINSFEDKQDIDFVKLSARGLFGIFGPTGSGKTTVLDAITLAIYGRIPRYNSATSKHTAFINANCTTALVRFAFQTAACGPEESYIIERSFKRPPADNESVAGYVGVLSRLSKETAQGVTVLEDKSGEKVTKMATDLVGLNYADFTRSVLLPQGRFSEFLLLKNQDRRIMLERIFKLEEYGSRLNERIQLYNRNLATELFGLEQSAAALGEVTEEKLEEESQRRKSLSDEVERLKKEKEETAAAYETYRGLFETALRYKEIQGKIAALQSKQSEMEDNRRILQKSRRAELLLAPLLEVKNLRKLHGEAQERGKALAAEYEAAKKLHEEYDQVHRQLSQKKDTEIPILSVKEKELEQAAETQREASTLELEVKALLEQYGGVNARHKRGKESLEAAGEEQKTLAARMKDISEKKEAMTVTAEQRQLIESGCEKEKSAALLRESFLEAEARRQAVLASIQSNRGLLSDVEQRRQAAREQMDETKGMLEALVEAQEKAVRDKTETFRVKQLETSEALRQKEEALRKKENALGEKRLSGMAAELAGKLSQGEPCPVCGSLEHPAPMKRHHEDFDALERENDSLRQEIEELRQLMQSLHNEALLHMASAGKDESSLRERSAFESQIAALEKQEVALGLEAATMQERLARDVENEKETSEKVAKLSFDIAKVGTELEQMAGDAGLTVSFLERLEEIRRSEREKGLLEKEEQAIRSRQEELSGQRERLLGEIAACETEMERIKAVGNEKRQVLDEKKARIDKICEGRALLAYLEQVRQEISDLNRNEKNARELCDQYDASAKTLLEKASGAGKEAERLSILLKGNESKLAEGLAAQGFSGEEEAEVAFLGSERQEELDKIINAHAAARKSAEEQLAAAVEKLAGESVSDIEEKHEQYKRLLNACNVALSQREKELAVSGERVRGLSENLTKLKTIWGKQAVLSKKQGLAKEIADLFKGSRFVEFVALRHLRYIAREASGRLKRMTSGRYALELDDADFIIRDDFNGGTRRPPAALSGGETFMASLCLALALSSKIQMKSHSDFSFFFLDEGFGSLDPAMLEVVVTALEQLRDEKVTVGVITHVEELKARIAESITVEPAGRGQGSRIVQEK